MLHRSCITRCSTAMKLATDVVAARRVKPASHRAQLQTTGAMRPSRRRHDNYNVKGRAARIKDIIDNLRAKKGTEFSSLHPREQLDTLRHLYIEQKARKMSDRNNGLPKYYSTIFEKKYYFKEDDVEEMSTLGRGPGGQACNRRKQTVILTHKPSGLVVKYSKFPSLWLNRRASRELMHLRLEEKLIGPRSILGLEKKKRSDSAAKAHAKDSFLMRVAKRAKAREASRIDFHGYLKGTCSLPSDMVQLLRMSCPTITKEEVYIHEMFNAQCNNWWNIMEHQFSQDSKVPLFFRFMFPSVPEFDDLEIDYFVGPWGYEQSLAVADIMKCRKDAAVIENVRRALRCFVEVFGLVLREGNEKERLKGREVVIEKDGLSWIENRCRMVVPPGQEVQDPASPLAQALFPFVFKSLGQLLLVQEAAAVKRFFLVESKLHEKKNLPCCWASKILRHFCKR